MSTEENKVIVRRFYEEVINQGNVDAIDELMDTDHQDHGEVLFGSVHGREAIKQGIIAFTTVVPDYHVTIEDMVAEGDMVGVLGIMGGTQRGELLGIPPTGRELSWNGIAMFRLANGKIVERWFNADSLSIMQQLGVGSPTG